VKSTPAHNAAALPRPTPARAATETKVESAQRRQRNISLRPKSPDALGSVKFRSLPSILDILPTAQMAALYDSFIGEEDGGVNDGDLSTVTPVTLKKLNFQPLRQGIPEFNDELFAVSWRCLLKISVTLYFSSRGTPKMFGIG